MAFTKTLAAAAVALALCAVASPSSAQESSGTPGTVWQLSSIQIEPGQYERYIDYLAGNWKRIQELGKKDGYIVSYHVWGVNNTRSGEPDLILAVEYKDYLNNAEQLAIQKKVEAMLQADARKLDTAGGERKAMRKVISNMELQEVRLK
jgi:hypothetical protein